MNTLSSSPRRTLAPANETLLQDAFGPACYGVAADPEGGTLLEYLRILNRRKAALVLFALCGVLLGWLLTRIQPRIFKARSLIEIENLNEDFLNMRNVSPTSPEVRGQLPEFNIRTQIAALQSRPVLERALQSKNLEKRVSSAAHRQLHSFWPQSLGDEGLDLHGETMLRASQSVQIKPQPGTRVIEISVDSTDPAIAADLANALITAFSEVSLETRWKSIQSTSEWLTRQLGDVKTKLQKSEDALQRYMRESDLTFLTGTAGAENTTSEERLKQFQLELSKAEADRMEKQSRYEQAQRASADSLPEVIDNATLREYRLQLTSLRRQVADLTSSFTSKYPKVVSLEQQVAALEAAFEKERANVLVRSRNELESAERREGLLRHTARGLMAVMAQESDKILHYSLLKREADTTRQLYDSMMQRVGEANLASAMKADAVHVIESATPPRKPYKPSGTLNIGLSLMFSLGLGTVVMIQHARARITIEGPGESVFQLNLPELGVIPVAAPARRLFRFALQPSAPPTRILGSNLEGASLTLPGEQAEPYRLTLASILLSDRSGSDRKVIAFSSATAKEGKTTITSNLGIALAQSGRRVLLIDGDLRRPRLHQIFGVDQSAGLSEALSQRAEYSVKETKLPNLFLLPSGKTTEEEMLFFPEKLRTILDGLKKNFDFVLIDTPPLLSVADARFICKEAAGCVLVFAQDTPRDILLLARQRLIGDGSNLLGTILNKWDPARSLRWYHRYTNYRTEAGAKTS